LHTRFDFLELSDISPITAYMLYAANAKKNNWAVKRIHVWGALCGIWWLSPPPILATGNTLCTSRYVDDVMFSRNQANWPESKTTCMLCPICQVAAPGRSMPHLTASCWRQEVQVTIASVTLQDPGTCSVSSGT